MVSNQTQKVILTNGFATSMLGNPNRAVIEFRRITIEELRQIIQSAVVENYIRHPSTVMTLNQLLQMQLVPNSGIYVYSGNERIVLVTLATPQRGQETSVNLDDLVMYEVIVRQLE